MAKIEVSFIESDRKIVMAEINSLGYGSDYDYAPYSHNVIIIDDISPNDKEKFICFLDEREISWGN